MYSKGRKRAFSYCFTPQIQQLGLGKAKTKNEEVSAGLQPGDRTQAPEPLLLPPGYALAESLNQERSQDSNPGSPM